MARNSRHKGEEPKYQNKLVPRPRSRHIRRYISKMATTSFYRELNNLSTADFYVSNKTKRRKLIYGGEYFAVERVIVEKDGENMEKEFLVLWENFSRYEASYEPRCNITEECIRYYHNPRPNVKDIVVCADLFCQKMEQSLIHNRRKETLTFEFRGDIFKLLFKDKGYMLSRWQVLEREHFPELYFPKGWDVRKNKHGEGMQLHYPIKVRWFICWSPLKFEEINSDIVPSKRAPFEKISIQVIKVAAI